MNNRDGPNHPLLTRAADVVVYDQSDGLFGELLDGSAVVARSREAQRRLRSIPYGRPDGRSPPSADLPVRFHNYSLSFVRVRWVDPEGNVPPSHAWTLAPNEELDQRAVAGHVFLLSVVVTGDGGERDSFGGDGAREAALGAFRPRRTLPSGVHHSVQVLDGDVGAGGEHGDRNNNNNSFILEVVLSDGSNYDALVVASFWIDREIASKQTRLDAVRTLQKIVSNVVKDPTNDRYRKLRMSNGAVAKNIGRHWSALEFLRVLGFGRKTVTTDGGGEEEYLIAESAPDESRLSLYAQGSALLEQLRGRCRPDFVADLAPPAPWDEPAIPAGGGRRGGDAGGGGGGGGRWGNAGSTNFITDPWARVERARRFCGRAGPRPAPGNAPSDRGRWGRSG